MQEHRLVTTRRARYYTIGGGEQPLSEAWIVLHGLGQLASVFIKYFQSIATPGRLIVAPEALNRYYVTPGASGRSADAKVGATWMTRMDRQNEIADYVDFLDAVWRETATGAARVTVLGFSQGVATACRWVAMGTSRIDRLVAWAGQLPPDVDPSVFAKLPGGVTLVAGTTDEYSAWIAEGNHDARLVAAGLKPRVVTFDGGHRMDRLTLDNLSKS
ncbi:MAG TPA: alpha/beta fold hydrolase, partial [Gemmatimonadaceae bacterium]